MAQTQTKSKTQEEFIKDSQLAFQMAFELIEKINSNKGEMGVTIKAKEFVEGKEVTDQDGNPIIDPATGQLKKYPDAYYVEVSNATFGTYRIKVDREVYERVNVGGLYILYYHLEVKEIVAKSKSGFEYVSKQLILKPDEFVDLKSYKVGL